MLEVDPANNALLRILADIRIERNEIEEAITVLEEAVGADPGDIEATLALAQLYRETGREAEAEELTASASNDPHSTSADRIAVASELYNRSESDPKAGEQAAAILVDVIESGEESADALFMLGNLRYRDQAYAEAADLLVRALDIDPRHPDEWARAATCLYRSGDAAGSLEVADEAKMLFPGQYPILSIGTEAALETGEYVRAERFASEALDVLGDGADSQRLRAGSLDRLGDAMAGQGKLEAARSYWRQAIEADPTIEGVGDKLESNR
jgi:tetratricopeptide (TPR) repeat protein